MALIEGRYGLLYTVERPEVAARFDDLVSSYLGFRRDIGDRLKAVLADDPDMPLAQVTKGYFFKLFGSAAMSARAARTLADADRAVAARGATDR